MKEETMDSGEKPKNGVGPHKATKPESPYNIPMPISFLLGSVAFASSFAFGVGYFCRQLLVPPAPVISAPMQPAELVSSDNLPPPVLDPCKTLPNFVYSSKHYETGLRATSDNMLVRHASAVEPDNSVPAPACPVEEDEEVVEEEHQPKGQHLLVDIKNVDGAFLNSELRLATATVDLINMSGLTMLSYHCHSLVPVGVSCVGVLLESHVSFHTWPIEGVITFDLFTCGPKSLLPLLDTIKGLFGVPRPVAVTGGSVEQPHMNWSYKKRGFDRSGVVTNPAETTDINMFLFGWMEYDMKQLVAEETTDFQTVEIYDVLNPRFRGIDSYRKSLANDGSYEAQNPELFRPDRIVYLDHIMQSRFYGEAAYHEALVHPALFSHDNPKRVAIIGGGEGATLREILKHNTIETVTMVEIDKVMVETSRKHLPEWSYCGNLVGSAESCFDDPRSEPIYTDAIGWFIENYGPDSQREKYDVIIMDALDPSSAVEFSDVLYNDDSFLSAISRALTEEGILVAQTGEAGFMLDRADDFQTKFDAQLQRIGFVSARSYIEAHGGFLGVWSYMIAFKERNTLSNWFANQAEVDFKIDFRKMETNDGTDTPFRYFDGASMMGYQYEHRIAQIPFCRENPTPPFCDRQHGLDPEAVNVPASEFRVGPSTIPQAGRGLFAKRHIPKGSYLATEELVHSIMADPSTVAYLEWMELATEHSFFRVMSMYLFGYGFGNDFSGKTSYSVEPSVLCFINHGCNGTYNMGVPTSVTEMTADLNAMPVDLVQNGIESSFRNPFLHRNEILYRHALESSLRDIQEGEELLDNYISFLTDDRWNNGVMSLRQQCLSQKVGPISQYEGAVEVEEQ